MEAAFRQRVPERKVFLRGLAVRVLRADSRGEEFSTQSARV
jgi:hypothetical protein